MVVDGLIQEALHNFVVQSYNELLILDCDSTAQLRCAELHTSYAEITINRTTSLCGK